VVTRTRALLAVIAILVLSAAYTDWRVFDLSRNVANNQQTDTSALCSFRADLKQRVTSTTEFLATHPHGIPGIPVGTLRVSLSNTQRTLYALRSLAGHCHR
jgi:hypothetical protein